MNSADWLMILLLIIIVIQLWGITDKLASIAIKLDWLGPIHDRLSGR
jgi:hypothetical protein